MPFGRRNELTGCEKPQRKSGGFELQGPEFRSTDKFSRPGVKKGRVDFEKIENKKSWCGGTEKDLENE